MKNTTKRWALGTIFAVGLGYITGLLTAPKSGRETRKELQDKALKVRRDSEKKLKNLHSDLDNLIKEGKTRSADLKATARKELTTALTTAQGAKEKAREALSALHEGDSDDKDLDKAIKEAKNAVDHLKKYLAK